MSEQEALPYRAWTRQSRPGNLPRWLEATTMQLQRMTHWASVAMQLVIHTRAHQYRDSTKLHFKYTARMLLRVCHRGAVKVRTTPALRRKEAWDWRFR
jgi:hypothetical protein